VRQENKVERVTIIYDIETRDPKYIYFSTKKELVPWGNRRILTIYVEHGLHTMTHECIEENTVSDTVAWYEEVPLYISEDIPLQDHVACVPPNLKNQK
jgi:hypothetical protein